MNINEIKVPTLQQLLELFPLGNIELDLAAQREVQAIFSFRNLLVRVLDPDRLDPIRGVIDEVMDQCATEERTRRGIDPDDMSEENRHVQLSAMQVHGKTFSNVAGMMRAQDAISAGEALAALDILGVLEKEAGETSHQRATQGVGALGQLLASMRAPSLPLAVIQCVVHSTLHCLFRDIVNRVLYRRYPGIRFPVHRLVVVSVDVPDESTVLQAVITGYQIPLLMSLQPKEFPEVLDSSMFEKRESPFGKIMGGPGYKKPELPKRNPPGQKDGGQI